MLGLDPAEATNDFRIVSIELVDGKPKVEWEPKANRWTGVEIQAVLKGAESLDGEWHEVDKASESDKAKYRFFKVEVELPWRRATGETPVGPVQRTRCPLSQCGMQFRLAGGAGIWYNLRRQDKGANQKWLHSSTKASLR